MTRWYTRTVVAISLMAIFVPGATAMPTEPQSPAAIDGTFSSELGVYRPRAKACVLFDTRHGPGKLAAGTTTTFALDNAPAQGGQSGCSIPSGAVAAQVNVVAIKPEGRGTLKLFPAGGSAPKGATIHFSKLDPALNVANAVVVAQDDAGWTVKVAGHGTHVQATVLGRFVDGGGAYAAAGHDHGFVPLSMFRVDVDQLGWTTIITLEMRLPKQCFRPFKDAHNVEITISGNVDTIEPANDLFAFLGLWVDGTAHPDANNPSGPRVAIDGPASVATPFSHTWGIDDLGPGIHSFQVRALYVASDYAVTGFDLVAKRFGWTCEA